MAKVITKKSDIKIIVNVLLDKLPYLGQNDFWEILDKEILQQKVRFPMVEYFTNLLLDEILYKDQIDFCDKINSLKREGGYVIVATVLKNRLNTDLTQSFEKAVEYFIEGDEWYVCDIIGEYVPDEKYLIEKHQLLFELSKKYEIPFRVKRFIPNDFRGENYKVAEKLFQESFFNQMSTGKNWEHLFWTAHDIQNMKSPIRTLAQMGMLDTIKNMRGDVLEKVKIILEA